MLSNVIPLKSPTTPPTRRVAPVEAKWLRQADMDTADIARDWYRGPNALRAQINTLDHRLRDLLAQYLSVREEHRAKGFAEFRPKFPAWLYWPLLGLAALLETPLNNSALGFLAMEDAETLMVAGSIGLLNVLGASFVGWKIRQAEWTLAALREWLAVLAVAVVAIAVMFGLAGLRLDDLLLKAKDAGLPVSAATFATFVALQLLFFVVGASLSYSMHPADAALERILNQQHRLRRRGDALLQQRATLASGHDRALGIAATAVQKTRAECLAKIAEYRDFNLATRSDAPPEWLREALDETLFRPVQLGTPLDANPVTFEELVRQVEQRIQGVLMVPA
jgi:hypothetical protein